MRTAGSLSSAWFSPVILAVIFASCLVAGKMCSVKTRAGSEEDLSTLQARTIAAFLTECRKAKTLKQEEAATNNETNYYSTDASEAHRTIAIGAHSTDTMTVSSIGSQKAASTDPLGLPAGFLSTDASTVHSTQAPRGTTLAICSFVTSIHNEFNFILQTLSVPFQLNFRVKIQQDAIIVLAEEETDASVFAEIVLGGQDNTRAVIRPCHPGVNIGTFCVVKAEHNEVGLVDSQSFRPFWIGYNGDVVTVGKGGEQTAFLQWDAGQHHGQRAHDVHVGILSYQGEIGRWEFYDFCE